MSNLSGKSDGFGNLPEPVASSVYLYYLASSKYRPFILEEASAEDAILLLGAVVSFSLLRPTVQTEGETKELLFSLFKLIYLINNSIISSLLQGIFLGSLFWNELLQRNCQGPI